MKKFELKRIIALIFAVIMVLSVVACTKNPDDPKESDKPTEAVTNPTDGSQEPDGDNATESPAETWIVNDQYEDGTTISIIDQDYGRHNGTAITNEIWIEKMTGDVLADAVWKRNELLKSTTGISVAYKDYDGNILDTLKLDESSGDYIYEVILVAFNGIATLFNNGLALDLKTIDLDLTYSWFDQQCNDVFTLKGKQFAFTSDISYIEDLLCIGVMFNTSIVEDNQFGDIYQMVIDKTWTFDEMVRMAEVASSGKEATTDHTMEEFFGISSQNDFSYYMLHSTGLTTLVPNEKGELVYNGTNEKLIDCLEDCFNLMSNETIFFNRQGTVGTQEISAIYDQFGAGKSLFLIRPIEALFNLRDRTDDFGIVPMPLYDPEFDNNYHTSLNTYGARATTILSYLPKDRYQKVIDAIQVLGMQSQKLVTPALYEICLGSRLVNDKVAPQMLDIIFQNKVYDIGFIFDTGSIRNHIVQKYAAIPKAASAIGTNLRSIEIVIQQQLKLFMNKIDKYGE